MKFPTTEEFVKSIAEKAFDEYEYEGKTLRQWVEILKDYDDKQTTLQRIVERLEKELPIYNGKAIQIVRKEGGL